VKLEEVSTRGGKLAETADISLMKELKEEEFFELNEKLNE